MRGVSEKEAVFTVKGLVLRVTDVGESDRMLTVLTAEEGKLSVWARGVRKLTSSGLSSAQLFSYANFTLRRGRDRCFFREANALEMFHGITASVEGNALATYLCELADEIAYPGGESPALLQLTLNALWAIAQGTHPLYIIKGAYELRAAAIAGFMPDLFSCTACEKQAIDGPSMLDVANGRVFCGPCYEELFLKPREVLSPREQSEPERDTTDTPLVWESVMEGTLLAMRYILYTGAKRQFSFTVPERDEKNFARVCERYLLHHIGHGYKSLSFYKSLDDTENELFQSIAAIQKARAAKQHEKEEQPST